jgi:hypothetical protein
MSKFIGGTGIVFSKLLGQGFLFTIGLLTGSDQEINDMINRSNPLERNDIIKSTTMLKRRLGRASEIVGAMASNRHIQKILGELTNKIALFLLKIKVPAIEISGIVIKSVVQVIQENSAIMGKGAAKTLWGFINTMITQIPIVGIIWSMMIFISTGFIYAIQFMNVITSKTAQTAIQTAEFVKDSSQIGGGMTRVDSAPTFKELEQLYYTLKNDIKKILQVCKQ